MATENVPSAPVVTRATSDPDGSRTTRTAPATGRGAQAGSGGFFSTGQTGPAVAVPRIPLFAAGDAGVAVGVAAGVAGVAVADVENVAAGAWVHAATSRTREAIASRIVRGVVMAQGR
jgi:hypothetical protein